MLYRYKLGFFVGVVASTTFFVAYVTGPISVEGPVIRALYISFSDHLSVERTLDYKIPLVESFDKSIHIFETSEKGSLTVDRDEWDLHSDGEFGERFFQNNLIFECTASFPVTWHYSGFGAPSVSEKNVRIHENFNDSSTYHYLSILNLMPLTEKSTGTYECLGGSNETRLRKSSLQIYVTGNTFLVDYDTYVEVDGKDEIRIPCPVTNTSANISLYFKDQAIYPDNAASLLTFDPKLGFELKPKFLEEQNDPWGQYYCRNEETNEKSGVVTIQPQKALLVHAIPETRTVFLSKPTIRSGGISSKSSDNKVKFVCQAKEEVTLKFLRVVANPMVHYDYNASSNFPFTAYAEANQRYFRNLSKIYCRTVRNNDDLYSWKVLFATQAEPIESMELQYDTVREEFSCCSSSNKRTKMNIIDCQTISECRIQGNCLSPGHKCNPTKVTELPERSGCVRYKLKLHENGQNNLAKERLSLESGLVECSIDDKSTRIVYFASQVATDNGTDVRVLTGSLSPSTSEMIDIGFNSTSIPLENYMEISKFQSKAGTSEMQMYVCRGAKFFVAVGFRWQTTDGDDVVNVNYGRDVVKGDWVVSYIQLPRQLKRVYCMAPLWSENGKWVYVKLESNNE